MAATLDVFHPQLSWPPLALEEVRHYKNPPLVYPDNPSP